MNDMVVLVTGGAGYIGSHTCIELLNRDYEVIVLDNFSNSTMESLQSVKKITGREMKVYNFDLRDYDKLYKLFLENDIDSVIHFAALKSLSESIMKPLEYYSNNVVGMINLCQVMADFGVKKIVFSSSSTVYGETDILPITEDHPLYATNPYGQTKIIGEKILEDLYNSDNEWRIVNLRYFNPIGAHKSGYLGENSRGIPDNLMPYITQVAAKRLNKLPVFGNNYATLDGTGVRDYIHVLDLAIGHIKALQRNDLFTGVSKYNLGTGKGYSVLEVVAAFESNTGIKIPLEFCPERLGDIAISYASSEKAKKELDWVAELGLDEMCKDEWRWQLNTKCR